MASVPHAAGDLSAEVMPSAVASPATSAAVPIASMGTPALAAAAKVMAAKERAAAAKAQAAAAIAKAAAAKEALKQAKQARSAIAQADTPAPSAKATDDCTSAAIAAVVMPDAVAPDGTGPGKRTGKAQIQLESTERAGLQLEVASAVDAPADNLQPRKTPPAQKTAAFADKEAEGDDADQEAEGDDADKAANDGSSNRVLRRQSPRSTTTAAGRPDATAGTPVCDSSLARDPKRGPGKHKATTEVSGKVSKTGKVSAPGGTAKDFFLTPAQRAARKAAEVEAKEAERQERAAQAAAEAATRAAEAKAKREAAAAAEAEAEAQRRAEAEAALRKERQEAKERWAAEQKKLKEDIAAVNAGRTVASIFQIGSSAAGASSSRGEAAREPMAAVARREFAYDVDDEELAVPGLPLSAGSGASGGGQASGERVGSGGLGLDPAWYEDWPWAMPSTGAHVGRADVTSDHGPLVATATTAAIARACQRRPSMPDSSKEGKPSTPFSLIEPLGMPPAAAMAAVEDEPAATELPTGSAQPSSVPSVPPASAWCHGMWSESLRPRVSDAFVGTRHAATQLRRWLEKFGDTAAGRTKADAKRAARDGRSAKRRKPRAAADSDDDFLDDSDSEEVRVPQKWVGRPGRPRGRPFLRPRLM